MHNSLSGRFRGSVSAWEAWWADTEGEHGERDEWLVAVEPERDAGEQTDLGVGGFDEALGEAGVERIVDCGAVGDDASLQFHECGHAGTARPFDPSIERVFAFVAFDCEHVTQTFLQQVRAPQSWGGLGDPVELVALAAGEVTAVLPGA